MSDVTHEAAAWATPQIAWGTPQMKQSLEALSAEANALASSRIIKTEEGRALIALYQRLVETLIHGAPKTTMPARHHE